MSDPGIAQRVKELIVRRLKLEIDPATIQDDAPLFGEGLGLDSIDALELVLGLEQEFGIKVQDEEVGVKAFASVNALVRLHRAEEDRVTPDGASPTPIRFASSTPFSRSATPTSPRGRVRVGVTGNGRPRWGSAGAARCSSPRRSRSRRSCSRAGTPTSGRRGFLAGIEGFQVRRPPLAGELLCVDVRLSARFGSIVRFDGEVTSGGEEIARGGILVRKGELPPPAV